MALQDPRVYVDRAKKELKQQGAIDFPVAAYESSHDGTIERTIPWHWHDELEIIHIVKGTMSISTPSHRTKIKEGEIIVLNSRVMHYALGDPSCTLHSFVFSLSLLTGSDHMAFYSKYFGPLTAERGFVSCLIRDEEAGRVFEEAFSAIREESFGYEFTVREALSKILLSVYKEYEDDISSSKKENTQDTVRLREMMQYIREHYGEEITLADLCGVANIGERECLRCFNRTIGESPIRYIMKYRLIRSAEMLRDDPGKSISEIAAESGFDSPSYFSSMFRRYYRCSPREYRMDLTGDGTNAENAL